LDYKIHWNISNTQKWAIRPIKKMVFKITFASI